MFLSRTTLLYAAPPLILGTLIGVYRLWFAGDKEAAKDPGPPTELPQTGSYSDPFGTPSSAGGATTHTGGTTRPPAATASHVSDEPVGDVDSATEVVKGLAASLFGAFPEAAQWAASPDAIRRGVAAVDCIAQGGSPRRHLAFLTISQPFKATKTASGWAIDPASYARYDRIVNVFCHGDAAKVGAAYRRIEPALDLAYRNLGYGQGHFRDILAGAGRELLAVPVPSEPVAIVPSGNTYSFADSTLQSSSDARKHLLRMGPANIRKVQARIRELAAAMDVKLTAAP